MKVLIPHASFSVFGGAEKVVANLATYLTSHGNDVHILTYNCPEEVYMALEGCQITTGSYNKLKEFMHEHYHEYDIVNSHNHPMELLLWPKKLPHVWSYNEAPYYVQMGEPINKVEREMVEKSVSVAVVANNRNEGMYNSIYNTPVIHNMYGIDAEYFGTNPNSRIRDKYNIFPSEFLISIVAWVHPNKKQRDFMPSFVELVKNIPNIRLLLAGTKEPNEVQYLLDIAKANKIEKYITFTGHVSQEEVRDIYYASNVIVCPFGAQGSYLTTLESLCTGKPVVVSPASMIGEDLANNNVAVVTNNYTQAIIDIYTKAVKPDYSAWKAWASQFTWDRYCSNMYKIFESLIKKVD